MNARGFSAAWQLTVEIDANECEPNATKLGKLWALSSVTHLYAEKIDRHFLSHDCFPTGIMLRRDTLRIADVLGVEFDHLDRSLRLPSFCDQRLIYFSSLALLHQSSVV